jgi:hypothetical protein
MKKTQEQMLIRDLEKGKSITALEALNRYGCFRLASRIFDLKKQGWKIDKKAIVKDGKTYAAYFIPKKRKVALAK